ncbi:hypothetical protein GCM10017687_78810 [Streptomyces echinatus]
MYGRAISGAGVTFKSEALAGSVSDGHSGRWAAPEGRHRAGGGCWGCGAWLSRRIQTGVTIKWHVLESLLAGDDEATVIALAPHARPWVAPGLPPSRCAAAERRASPFAQD